MTSLPLHSLDSALLEQAVSLLDDSWLTTDPDIAGSVERVLARGVGQDWHKAGTLRHHLQGVARTLTAWKQPRHVRLLGLMHSVYGNDYVDFVKFDPVSERQQLAAITGDRAEALIHLFCTMSRTRFVQQLVRNEIEPDGSVILPTGQGSSLIIAPDDVAAFIVVTLADMFEQWYSWQDDIYAQYPDFAPQSAQVHWAASLWPGPMRPTSFLLSLLACLRSRLEHPGLAGRLPDIPVLAGSQLTAANEAAAVSLYWSVVQNDQPLTHPAAAIGVLEQSVALNPWVAEPQFVLAQLYLSQQQFDQALAVARSGLQLASAWGNAWDKRVSWEGWLAWGRVLADYAARKEWPDRLDRLNNVALR